MIVKRPRSVKRYVAAVCAFLAIGAGVYMMLLVYAPALPASPVTSSSSKAILPSDDQVSVSRDAVYIPKAGIVVEFAAGNEETLNNGLWHRYPDRGNPAEGGNFILAGHRFEMGLTPARTVRKSPLYNIHRVDVGDAIFVDFQGKRYKYEVTRRYKVKPEDIAIEALSTTAKLTLYTCTLKGETDGREVIEAGQQ